MKKEIASAPILAYFNPHEANYFADRCQHQSLGACLLQDAKPVYFESKAPTDAWKGYVIIELESLAVAWAMEKFHHFLFEKDQKLLEAIISKSLNQAIPRLQRIFIRTFAYHFTVKYIPGSANQLVDCLS